MKVFHLSVVALAMAVAVGGCTELNTAVNNVSGIFLPESGFAQGKESAEVDDNDIDALINFQTAASPAPELHPAATYIENLGQQVIAAMADKSLSDTDRVRYFGELLARDLDIPIIARFVLGKHWRKATKQQRRAYVGAFSDFIVYTYSTRLGGASVDYFEITETRSVGKKDILVESWVVQINSSRPIRADWRMRERGGRFRILDVAVEGISMALMLRQEFDSVLRTQGGVNGLIKTLRARMTAAAPAARPGSG